MKNQPARKWFKRPLPPDDFEALIAPHVESLYRAAFRFTGHQEDAEDLVQDLLVKLYPKSVELGAIDKLRPWLLRALYNLFIDGRRRHARSPQGHLESSNESGIDADGRGDLCDRIASPEAEPDKFVEHKMLEDHLIEAMEVLSAEHRAVLMLHDVEGYSLVELADSLGIPLGTLKSRLFRARGALKDMLMARKVKHQDLFIASEVDGDEVPILS